MANKYRGSGWGVEGERSGRPRRQPSGISYDPPRKDKSCCFAGQAVKAVWMRKFRLARRFARLDVKTRLGIL